MTKKISIFLITTILLLSSFSIANAAQTSQLPTEGIKSSDPLVGKSSDYNNLLLKALTGSLFVDWACQIQNNQDGTVTISGFTQAVTTSSNVQVTIYLQRWNGSSWVDINNVTKSLTNNSYVLTFKNVAVSKGYNYRARATHYILNGTSESKSSTSSYITIN